MLPLLLLMAAGPVLQTTETPTMKHANRLLRRGRYVQAADVLVELSPEHPGARVQLVRATFGVGECAQGERLLEQLPLKSRQDKLSRAAATCKAMAADWLAAAQWAQDAEHLGRKQQASELGTRLLYLARAGEWEQAQELYQALQNSAPAHERTPILMALLALDVGDVERVDMEILSMSQAARDRPNVHRIQAQLELDLGNPVLAQRYAVGALFNDSVTDPRSLALLAESRRRLGYVDGASQTLARKPLVMQRHPRLRAILIRVRVDQGHLKEARELVRLALEENGSDPQVLASVWYYHRAAKTGQEALWASRWETVNTSALRSLSQL